MLIHSSVSLSLSHSLMLSSYTCVCVLDGWMASIRYFWLCMCCPIHRAACGCCSSCIYLTLSFVRSFWGCDGPSAESLPSDCRDMRGEALMSCCACALHRRLRPNVYANDLAICTAISSCWRGCSTVCWLSVFLTYFPLAQQMVFASLRCIVRRVEHQQIDSSRPLHATSLGRPRPKDTTP